ncbi:MAG: hypothetical protein MJA31_12020 [Clostridia bacterium]|nr:hypothetical protein [Clostridia bacterium]
MGFVNIQSVLMYDSLDSVHNLYVKDENLTYVSANSVTKNMDSQIIEKNVKEFDACIDENNAIILLCKTGNNQLVLHEISNKKDHRKVVGDRLKPGLEDVHVFGNKDDINVIYTLPDEKYRDSYYIMHSHYKQGEWENTEAGRYMSQGLLNNEIKVYEAEQIFIGFVEYRDNKSCFRVRRYDGKNWSKDLLRVEKNQEVYWYDFQKNGELFEFAYASKADDQFQIQYEAYDKNNDIVYHHELSNPSSCMHPVFVSYRGEQFIAWVELDYVLSCRMHNDRRYFDGPYRWKESKNSDFLMYKFCYNNERIKNKLGLSCSRVYGSFPSYSLIGFGNMKNNVEAVPIEKRKSSGGEQMEQGKKPSTEKEKQVEAAREPSLAEKVNTLKKRAEDIENYFKRKSRSGGLFGQRR